MANQDDISKLLAGLDIGKAKELLKEATKQVSDLDAAMTALYKITDETDTKYQDFLTKACKNAKGLGLSLTSLIEQSSKWAKLGYSLDQSGELAKTSSIYTNISGVDKDAAISDLAAAMQAFNIAASDSIKIVDSLNKLENEFSVSAGDLGSGLQKSASEMADAGTNLYETLAMLAAGSGITQDADEFGSFLKAGAMRIRGMKDELEALGEETDDSIRSIREVQSQILGLTQGEVNIFDSSDQFRGYYEIMEDIAEVYGRLSGSDQGSLSEILFGSQKKEQGDALIHAFQSGDVQKAYEAAVNASGSAYESQERWMESLEAKTARLEAAFQSLSNTALDSGLLKFFVDLGAAGVSGLDAVIDKLGSVNALAAVTGGTLGAKNLGQQIKTT